jgi:hypothetical protein
MDLTFTDKSIYLDMYTCAFVCDLYSKNNEKKTNLYIYIYLDRQQRKRKKEKELYK